MYLLIHFIIICESENNFLVNTLIQSSIIIKSINNLFSEIIHSIITFLFFFSREKSGACQSFDFIESIIIFNEFYIKQHYLILYILIDYKIRTLKSYYMALNSR